VVVLAPMPEAPVPDGRLGKRDFQIDPEAASSVAGVAVPRVSGQPRFAAAQNAERRSTKDVRQRPGGRRARARATAVRPDCRAAPSR